MKFMKQIGFNILSLSLPFSFSFLLTMSISLSHIVILSITDESSWPVVTYLVVEYTLITLSIKCWNFINYVVYYSVPPHYCHHYVSPDKVELWSMSFQLWPSFHIFTDISKTKLSYVDFLLLKVVRCDLREIWQQFLACWWTTHTPHSFAYFSLINICYCLLWSFYWNKIFFPDLENPF